MTDIKKVMGIFIPPVYSSNHQGMQNALFDGNSTVIGIMDSKIEAEKLAEMINSHDNLTNQVADLNLELACVYKNLKSAYARAAISREKSIVQIDELRAALGEIKNITGKLSGQNPANFCEEVAMEHDAATFQIYEISNKALCKALKDGEL